MVVPKRGDKRGLVDLAARNADQAYQARFNQGDAAHYDGLETLRVVLGLPALPRRIRVLRHLDHSGARDGRVDGGVRRRPDEALGVPEVPRRGPRPAAAEPAAEPPVAASSLDSSTTSPPCSQVVLRRYRRALEGGGPFPDLILIDGGKGQLSAAYAALEELGLSSLVAVGLAKKEELLFTRDRDEPLALPRSSPALLLLEQVRDEAHRFAVTFHRQARRMRDLRSELDAVPGVGPRRRRALLDRLRQPGRRAPRQSRGPHCCRRPEGGRRGARLLRRSALARRHARHPESPGLRDTQFAGSQDGRFVVPS